MSDPAAAYNSPDYVLERPARDRLGETLPARVGQMAPEFDAQLLDGGTFRLRDARDTAHVVLLIGSITSPMCAINVPELNALHAEYGGRGVQVYLVYTKESHPGERYPHHTSMEQKIAHARDLRRLENVQFPILVDSLEGTIHQSYGNWPTSLFVVHRNGQLVFRSTIAHAPQLRFYLGALLEWDAMEADPERVPHVSYTEWVLGQEADEAIHHRVYDRAGPKAFEDYWQLFPANRDRWPRPPRAR
jgi:peroxiredoxin